MTAYLPRDPAVVAACAALLGSLVVAGFAIVRDGRVVAAWVLTILGVFSADRLLRHEAPGLRMVGIIAVLLTGMKVVTWSVIRRRGSRGGTARSDLRMREWLAFAAWPGMRPADFATLGNEPRSGVHSRVLAGLKSIACGLVLVMAARAVVIVWPPAIRSAARCFVATALLLPGLSLILHFGLFGLATALWRSRGVACENPFRRPLRSNGLAELWSRRWNVGFSEMIATVVDRPLRARVGESAALLVSFCASGLLHELAITVPVGRGYGLPTLYFAVQGAFVLAERRFGPIHRLALARAWMFAGLLVPLPLCFPLPFLRGVIWPLIGLS
ncbi:MAG TPA: MBOAT family protein [Thermoanaerobaculia bacterium]|nr:MBOAT family protein [Thermoanaerobaculia bacterium]